MLFVRILQFYSFFQSKILFYNADFPLLKIFFLKDEFIILTISGPTQIWVYYKYTDYRHNLKGIRYFPKGIIPRATS